MSIKLRAQKWIFIGKVWNTPGPATQAYVNSDRLLNEVFLVYYGS